MRATHAAEIGFLHGRVALDLVRRAFDQHAAFLQHGDALDQFEQRVHVMIDDDHGAALADRLQQLDRLDAFARAHAGERLVEQQKAGRGRQRQADFQPPLLAVGELRHRHVGASVRSTSSSVRSTCSVKTGDVVRQAEQVEAEFAAQLGERRDRQVLAHGQPGEQLVDLIALGQAELAHVGDAQCR